MIGGATLCSEAIKHPTCEKMCISRIQEDYDCDALSPKIDNDIHEKIEEKQLSSMVINEACVRKRQRLSLFECAFE